MLGRPRNATGSYARKVRSAEEKCVTESVEVWRDALAAREAT
jgi:hypothetical protein